MYFVYILQNQINKKLYVGYTAKPKRRRREHFKFGYQPLSKKHLYRAMKHYGTNNFTFTIIEEFEEKHDVCEAEAFWIDYFRSWDASFGYNESRGGEYGRTGSKHSQETKDNYSKRRQGSKSSFAKLDEEMVLLIRQEYATTNDPLFVNCVAQKYNVSMGCIYALLQGKTWKHVPIIKRVRKILKQAQTIEKIRKAALGNLSNVGSKNSQAKLSEDNVREMKKLFEESDKSSETKKALATQFKTSIDNVWQILAGRRWKHIK